MSLTMIPEMARMSATDSYSEGGIFVAVVDRNVRGQDEGEKNGWWRENVTTRHNKRRRGIVYAKSRNLFKSLPFKCLSRKVSTVLRTIGWKTLYRQKRTGDKELEKGERAPNKWQEGGGGGDEFRTLPILGHSWYLSPIRLINGNFGANVLTEYITFCFL